MIASLNMSIVRNIYHKYEAVKAPKVAIISLTTEGRALAQRLQSTIFPEGISYVKESKQQKLLDKEKMLIEESAFKTIQTMMQASCDLIISIMATGITVRAIAPFIQDKTIDPAIIVMDDQGEFVISLLSGHIGHANQWSREIAETIGGQAVITTATDVRKRMGLDDLAKSINGYYRQFKVKTRQFNQMIADNQKIALMNQAGINLPENSQCFCELDAIEWQNHSQDYQGLIVISYEPLAIEKYCLNVSPHQKYVQIIPRKFVVGVGCRRNTSIEVLERNFQIFMKEMNLDTLGVQKIVSIDVKKDELAIISLAKRIGVNFETFSKEELLAYEPLFEGSDFVKKAVGVASVAQASAYHEANGNIMSERYANEGVTFALAKYE
ncbi:cobalt-precorrin 5A hydrolase [Facklamia lactis]|uniref:cobalt-precorrin 5A hydrolase n=1 Tax=Facklamia lactis TaxID=2749967 RepID=UPI0018CC9E15|nr:cobalt-precorrin 5A hydrolase [Facklamia lactis]MBG9979500.1 cobalt-precorrin 5A hydrolase [Facklamia lactis]